jgi:hypothetical protein
MNILNHKKTILIIIAILILFFGYWFFFLSKTDTNSQSSSKNSLQPQSSSQVKTSGTPYDKEFVASLLGLNSVDINVSVFQSKVYQALSYPQVPFVVNYSRESGRDNPFLPIGIDSSNNAPVLDQNKSGNNIDSTTTDSSSTVNISTTSNSVVKYPVKKQPQKTPIKPQPKKF